MDSKNSFTVHVLGRPAPQGSKIRTQYGMREASKYLKPWREAVVLAVKNEFNARQEVVCFDEPCRLIVTVFIDPPQKLTQPFPASKRHGDTSKHVRAVEDALVDSGLVTDDSLFVDIVAHKRWATNNPAGAWVTVECL